MIRIKLIHLTLILWCCVLYAKTGVECLHDNGAPVIRHKRLLSETTSDKDLLKGLVLEALELENDFIELNKSSNMTALYQSLLDRVQRVRLSEKNDDNERARSQLLLILRNRLIDLEKEDSLIVDLDAYVNLVISNIERRNRMIPAITGVNDVDLENSLNQLRFRANGNFILNEYQHYMEGFRLTYFPYAACYLESLSVPNSPTAYGNLTDMTSSVNARLNESKRYIEDIKERDVIYVEGRKREDAFYTWKNSDVRDKIRQLFKGEKITLLADVKTAAKQLNALKFSKLDFVFRSSNRTVKNQLNNALKSFGINLKHSGLSTFRYNNHFYQLTSTPMLIFFSYEKTRPQLTVPVHRNGVYTKLSENRPVLSPYTEWQLRLTSMLQERFQRLTPFEELDIDIELHGSGAYVEDDLSMCEEEKVSKFYTKMEN